MKKILMAMMLCAIVFASSVEVFAYSSMENAMLPDIPTDGDIWDGVTLTRPTKIDQHDDEYYYVITKCSELAYVARNGGEWLTRNYLLASNLIMNDTRLELDEAGNLLNEPAALNKWIPIGNDSNRFTGKLDGAGYVISGLYVDQDTDYAGLIGCTGGSAVLQCVTVMNAFVKGGNYVGGITGAGVNLIKDCMFSGAVKGSDKYVGGIAGRASSNVISCVNYGAISGAEYIGGIAGSGTTSTLNKIRDCINYGTISDGSYIGGIVGENASISNCVNYGEVNGKWYVGGIGGCGSNYSIGNCLNYGMVKGSQWYTGGISGYGYNISYCANYGAVTGGSFVGGINGSGSDNKGGKINYSMNNGTVSGNFEYVGGIAGTSVIIQNSYNTGDVKGESYIGGIAGSANFSAALTISNCYSIGSVMCAKDGSFGGIVGSDGVVWGDDSVIECYYLGMDGLYGCGGVEYSDTELDGIHTRTAEEFKEQTTYSGWDYDTVWTISPQLNNGFPYLTWQDVSIIPLTGLKLARTKLALGAGDTTYLTVNPQPTTAELPALTWESSDTSVATVNENGRVTAVGEGASIISVTGGGFSACCEVTVKNRTGEEYRIGTLIVRDGDGKQLMEIPSDLFYVTIPITKQAEGGDSLIVLASYNKEGQYRGMMFFEAEELDVGATIRITLPLDNTLGDIAQLKAFALASFGHMTPLGATGVFPKE